MRIDKFIWCVRKAKTRSQAAASIEAGKVKLNEEFLKKTSKEIQVGAVFFIRETPIWRSYKVLSIPKSRVGAKLVDDCISEITSDFDLALLETAQKEQRDLRMHGIYGRPTKKNRRDIEDFFGE